ncbi:PP2C family protein-serine/threonine phosphatase [Planctomycetota bacterium]
MPGHAGKEAEDLKIILDITRGISRDLDLDSLLPRIISETSKILNADRSSLFILDSSTNELWSKIAEGIGDKEIRVPLDATSIVGSVALSKTLLNIPDAYKNDLFNKDIDKRTGYRTRSILSAPLLNFQGVVVGVIQVLNKKEETPFTPYDEDLLQAVSASAALAIERAMLIQEFLETQKLKQEMQIARSIQKSLIPESLPSLPFIAFAGYSEACDETGGDYYDVFHVEKLGIAMVAGDISGHGVGAALLMATARAFLKGLIQNDTDISRVFAGLNNLLEQDMDESSFMTLCMLIIDSSRNLHYISAGHEPPLIYHPSKNTFTSLESTGTILGMIEDMDYDFEGPTKLESEDIIILCTDGIFEAMNESSEPFGRERLKKNVSSLSSGTSEEIMSGVIEAVKQFSGTASQRDDITLLIGKVT